MWLRPLIPVIAIPVTFIITSVLILLAGANPFEAYFNFLVLPLSTKVSAIEVLVKSTPLLLTGAAVAFAFNAGYYNIGAEGQLYAGAIMAAWLGIVLKDVPPILGIPAMVLGGFVAGMIWALGPALLKVKLNVDEVVTTLLLNSVILFITSFVLNGPWRNPVSMWPQSPDIEAGTVFFKLIARSRLHFGFLVALAVIIIEWIVLSKTSFGLKMRAIGLSKEGARFAGIKVNKTMLIVALVSGGIAGLAGAGEVAGIHFHLIDAISDGLGYSGIVIATLGGLNPFGTGIAALFMGLIDTGAQTVSRTLGVPVYLGDVVQSTLLLVTLALFVVQNFRIRRVEA
jgi:simple sugar transport system permease protein